MGDIAKKVIELRVKGGAVNWPDYVIRVWPWDAESPYVICVEAFEVAGRNGMEPDSPLLFEGKDAKALPQDLTTDIDAAESIVEGTIKWDGCSDLTMGYMHHCDRAGVVRLGILFDRLFTAAKDLMKRDDGYLD